MSSLLALQAVRARDVMVNQPKIMSQILYLPGWGSQNNGKIICDKTILMCLLMLVLLFNVF